MKSKWNKLKVNEIVWTILRKVSSSGMDRVIDAYVFRDGNPVRVIALVTEEQKEKFLKWFPLSKHYDGFKVNGCGMDMGFHLVYELSSIVFPDGFMVKGIKETDGGYALNQRWL